MDRNSFPPNPVKEAVVKKMPALKREGFGYEILPFEHARDGDIDVGLSAFSIPTWYGVPSSKFRLLAAPLNPPTDGFAQLVDHLNECYGREIKQMTTGQGFVCLVFCSSCRQLSLMPMKNANLCGMCGEDLRLQ
jgi:hypothetical protein